MALSAGITVLRSFQRHELERMADEMHDASLNDGLGKDGVDRLGKALQAVDDGDQDVGDAAVLQFVHDTQPELGAFRLLDPDAQNLPGAVGQDAERDVDGLVANKPLVPNLDPDGIEKDQRIERVKRSVLPLADLVQNRISDRRDQVRRHVGAVELFEMPADLSHRHAARIH